MKRKHDFRSNWLKLCNTVEKAGTIGDAKLMMELGFTPTTWKIWQPKFREMVEDLTVAVPSNDGARNDSMIFYDEERKTWRWELIPNLLHADDDALTNHN